MAKTKYMTTDQEKIEKVTKFKYPGQTTHLKDTTKEEIYARIRAAWKCLKTNKQRNKEILQDKQLPISQKSNKKPQQQQQQQQQKPNDNNTKQVMDQCVLPTMTYGC